MAEKAIFLKGLIFLAIAVEMALAWSYDNPSSWKDEYPTCGGRMQTPINLSPGVRTVLNNAQRRRRDEIVALNRAPSFKLVNYKSFLSGAVKLSNNGHTVVAEPRDSSTTRAVLRVVNRQRTFEYAPLSLHFHWGAPGKPGSEHVMNNRRYDAELHIVHQNTNPNVEPRFQLAVLGLFLQVDDFRDGEVPAVSKLIKYLPLVKKYESETTIRDGLNVEKLLRSNNIDSYYNYQGSLTTPPCSETVTWFVFTDVLQVTSSELKNFFTLEDDRNRQLLSNFRPVQPLGNRTIFYSAGFTNYY